MRCKQLDLEGNGSIPLSCDLSSPTYPRSLFGSGQKELALRRCKAAIMNGLSKTFGGRGFPGRLIRKPLVTAGLDGSANEEVRCSPLIDW